MGVQQTEIDALAALQPRLLDKLVRKAIKPFYDSRLDERVALAKMAWMNEAQAQLESQLDGDAIGRIRTEAAGKLEQLREEIDAINAALDLDVSDFDLPEIVVPLPELDADAVNGLPLIDSRWDWVAQTIKLKQSKAYTGVNED